MDPDKENDFILLFRDASKKHGPAVNKRRPYHQDLLYPVPELTPFIGKKKLRESVQQRLQRVAAESAAAQNSELGAELPQSSRSNAQSSSSAMRSKSTGNGKPIFSVPKKSRGNVMGNNSISDRISNSVS